MTTVISPAAGQIKSLSRAEEPSTSPDPDSIGHAVVTPFHGVHYLTPPCLCRTNRMDKPSIDLWRSELRKMEARYTAGSRWQLLQTPVQTSSERCWGTSSSSAWNLEKVPTQLKTSCMVPVPKTPGSPATSGLWPSLLTWWRPLRGLFWTSWDLSWAQIWTYSSLPTSQARDICCTDSWLNRRRPTVLWGSCYSTSQGPSTEFIHLCSGRVAAWTLDCLTNRTHYVKLQDCVSKMMVCSTGGPTGDCSLPCSLHSLHGLQLQLWELSTHRWVCVRGERPGV